MFNEEDLEDDEDDFEEPECSYCEDNAQGECSHLLAYIDLTFGECLGGYAYSKHGREIGLGVKPTTGVCSRDRDRRHYSQMGRKGQGKRRRKTAKNCSLQISRLDQRPDSSIDSTM